MIGKSNSVKQSERIEVTKKLIDQVHLLIMTRVVELIYLILLHKIIDNLNILRRTNKIIKIYNSLGQDRDKDKERNRKGNDKNKEKEIDRDKDKDRDRDRKNCIDRIKKELNLTEEQILKDNQKNNIWNATKDQNHKNHLDI